MIWIALLACAEPEPSADEVACALLEDDSVHALSPSADAGLEDAAAQFHVASHHHVVSGEGFLWVEGADELVSFQTDAAVLGLLHDGEAVELGEPVANTICPEDLPTSFGLLLEGGLWEFQVDGGDGSAWLALPQEGDGHDHEH